MFVWYLFRLRTQAAKPLKNNVCAMTFQVFTHQKNISFNDFHDFCCYLFWHRFWKTLGIDFANLGIKINVFSPSFFMIFGMVLLLFFDFYQKWFPCRARGSSFFGYFFAPRSLLLPKMYFGTSLGSLWHHFGGLLMFLVPFRLHSGIGNLSVRHPNL